MKYRLLQDVRINKRLQDARMKQPCEHFGKRGTVITVPSDTSRYYRVVVDGGQVIKCTEDQLLKWQTRQLEVTRPLNFSRSELEADDRSQHEEQQWEARTGR
jgi:hypothetical protein